MSVPSSAICLAALAMAAAVAVGAGPAAFDVRTLGATGDGRTLDTAAIQKAIDQCTAAGGGTVVLPGEGNARYVTGTVYLKSNATFRIESVATLLGSASIADYTTDTDRTMYRGEPYMDRCLIFVHNASNVTIEGPGTIDGQGKRFPNKGDRQRNRPKLIRLLNSARLRMRDLNLEAPVSWTTEWRYSDDIEVRNVKIQALANSNGDGLDFDGCTNIRVADCTFDTSDDSICLQTSMPDKPCRDVKITGCSFTSRWAGVRISLLSRGDFEDVTITDCTFKNHNDSGLKIQMNEGGTMRNMTFRDLTMTNVPRPVFLTFCQKNAWVDSGPELPPMKAVKDLTFSNIKVDNLVGNKGTAFIVTGMPGKPVENLTFENITATFPGSGTEQDAAGVHAELTPENLGNRWPEYSLMRGVVPAHGLYARHVKGLTVKNAKFVTTRPDARPAMVFVDVTAAQTSDEPRPDER